MKAQAKNPILNGRPHPCLGPPIIIYDRQFSKFRDMNEEQSPLEMSSSDYDMVKQFITTSSAIYDNEELRREALVELLEHLLGKAINSQKSNDGTNSDSMVTIDPKIGQLALLLLLELRNEIGTGNCDPSIQSALSYTRWWSQRKVGIVHIANTSCAESF
jgi:hypothetical protein